MLVVLLLGTDVGFDLFSDFNPAVKFNDKFVGIKNNSTCCRLKTQSLKLKFFSILKVLEDIIIVLF